MLGDSYRQGLGIDVDYQEALRLFKSAAQKGNPWAHNNLGNMYRLGQGVPTDLNEAAKNYRIASDKGNGAAQANLSNLYRLGQGVERNGDTAFQLALKSSKQNFGAGWNVLGLLYRDGFGVRQDSTKAIESFKSAVSPTVRLPAYNAYYNLGAMYANGIGVTSDAEQAVRWLEFGAKLNQLDSLNLLSSIVAVGAKSVPADPSRAFSLARQAYDKGSADAGDILGWFYRDGVGTAKNVQMAVQYFTEARDKGVVAAYANLGRLHLEGRGVNKDAAKAHEYFLVAKSQIDRLGKGNKKFIEDYFASASSEVKVVDPVKLAPASDSTKPQVALNSQALDTNQQGLIERLEKLQKQIETLQASANTINESQVFQGQVQMANRRALVIGNDKYMHVSQLVNAREDASSIAKKLTQLGYKVSLHQDLTEKAFKQALREFRGTLDGGEEVLFYFAGHGVQLGAANYLLPTDTKGDNEDQVKDEAIELQRVLDDLKFKNSNHFINMSMIKA
jgi:TPR repeat protein